MIKGAHSEHNKNLNNTVTISSVFDILMNILNWLKHFLYQNILKRSIKKVSGSLPPSSRTNKLSYKISTS